MKIQIIVDGVKQVDVTVEGSTHEPNGPAVLFADAINKVCDIDHTFRADMVAGAIRTQHKPARHAGAWTV